jgi:hypothetical protein
MSQSYLWSGIILGGVVISAIGSASTLYVEKQTPSAKSIMRDFLIGAALVGCIIQLLPESSQTLFSTVFSMLPTAAAFSGLVGGAASSSDGGAQGEEQEVKVGVPKF